MQDSPRRLLLRVALKLLTFTALIIVAIALLNGRDNPESGPEKLPGLKLSLDAFSPDRAHRIDWQGGPLQLLYTQAGEHYLFYDRGGNLGCPLAWQPPGSNDAPLQPWPGGFRDQCSGTWYRLDGRVLPDQTGSGDLQSPPHRRDGNLLQIGENGDNAAPAVPQ